MDTIHVTGDELNIESAKLQEKTNTFGIGRVLLIALGGFVGTVAFAVGLAFWATSGIVATADTFFEKLRVLDHKAAFELGSIRFQREVGFVPFKAFVKRHRLDSFSATQWSSRETSGIGDGASGTLEGSLVGEDGGAEPVEISLIKQSGVWRIHAIDMKNAGVDGTKRGTIYEKRVPKERKLIVLVHASDMAFAKAVEATSMRGFHNYISRTWASHHSVKQLDGFFADFITKKPNLTELQDLRPVFTTPAIINDKGWLVVRGFYDVGPKRAKFTHKYVYEGYGWKLVGYSLDVSLKVSRQAQVVETIGAKS